MHRGCSSGVTTILQGTMPYAVFLVVVPCCSLLLFHLSIPPILCCLSGNSQFGVSSSFVTIFGVNSGCFFLMLFSHWQFLVDFSWSLGPI